jgi:hypothetical protein
MSKSCGDCAAWHPTHAGNGECRLTPPQTIFMGFQPPRLTGQPPQPLIAAAFPAVQATAYCHQWSPKAEELATGIGWRQTAYEVDENGVGNLVTREVPPTMHSIDGVPMEPPPAPEQGNHAPVKVNGEWECGRCGVSEDVFGMVTCNAKR